MSEQIVFQSYEQFFKHFFPKEHEKQRLERMTPEERGRDFAYNLLEKIFGHKRVER